MLLAGNGPRRPLCARYLSLAKREEIAVAVAARAGGAGDRGAAGPGAVDGEPGAAAERVAAGVPGGGGAGAG